MTYTKALREQLYTVAVFSGGTGSGKTKSALRFAAGLAGGKRFAAIDTERRRMRHYADQHDFDIDDMAPPFRPMRFAEKIEDAEKAGYGVLIIDSFSHEWDGDGGVLDWQSEILEQKVTNAKERAQKDNETFNEWKVREALKIGSWAEPKGRERGHGALMRVLLQTNMHLVLCLRAKEKIEIVKEKGKTVVRPHSSAAGLDGWVPITEEQVPFEATFSFMFFAGKSAGVPVPIKLQGQHQDFFPLDRTMSEKSGELVAAWARGGVAKADSKAAATLDECLRAFDAAVDKVTLEAAWRMTRGLPKDQLAEATKFYTAKAKELRKK